MVSAVRVDLRSDTVTRPTAAMRQSMAHAEVGDDVFGEDPTVGRLEELAAECTGFEAALGQPVPTLTRGADSVMFCLSKGLGSPVGSLLCGGTEFIREARVARKRLGGGMRQVGILAAAGVYALQHHVDRLADDHARAARLAAVLAESPHFRLDPATVQTNIVVVETRASDRRDVLIEELRREGVLAVSMGPGRIRFVTHLDVDDAGIDRAASVVRGLRGAP
jgi:threonine aldolase